MDAVLQLKATESLAYVKEAIAAHPDINVVVPHELYESLAYHPELLGHVIDGHESLDHLNDQVAHAAEHAEAAGIHFHFPVIALLWVAGQNYHRYRKRRISMEEALRNFGERGALAVIAGAAGWAAALMANVSLVGIPISMGTRLLGGQFLHNRRRRELLDENIEVVSSSRACLELQLPRPMLFEGPS